MDVFLIPVAPDRYELYCELPDTESADGPPPPGIFRGLVHRFREALAEVERERHRPRRVEPGKDQAEASSWFRQPMRRVMCRIAETIAEQRLLWHMRRELEATAIYPEDLAAPDAMRVVRSSMQSDYERHRFWLMVDGIVFVLSGALTVVPGPNLVAYYFGFRLVGHFFSMRGARQALGRVAWTTRPSAPLAELRTAIALAPAEREARVSDIAARLRLERLASFFQRTAVPSS